MMLVNLFELLLLELASGASGFNFFEALESTGSLEDWELPSVALDRCLFNSPVLATEESMSKSMMSENSMAQSCSKPLKRKLKSL